MFGDNVQDSIKEINELAKVSKSEQSHSSSGQRYYPYDKSDKRPSNTNIVLERLH